MNGYQLRTEQKKKNIRQSAFELFAAFGIEKVSLAEIAKKAKVSPVTIFNYFGTKDKLVIEVMSGFLENAWEQRLELLQSDLPFHRKVEKMIFDTMDLVEHVNPDVIQHMLSNIPEMKENAERIFAESLPVIVRFIDNGKKEGYISKEISTRTILIYFNLIKEMKLSSSFKEAIKDSALIKELTHLIFYGLLRDPVKDLDS